MTKTTKEGMIEAIETCIVLNNEKAEPINKFLSIMLLDAMIDVTKEE